jgi:hypothetical protein
MQGGGNLPPVKTQVVVFEVALHDHDKQFHCLALDKLNWLDRRHTEKCGSSRSKVQGDASKLEMQADDQLGSWHSICCENNSQKLDKLYLCWAVRTQ